MRIKILLIIIIGLMIGQIMISIPASQAQNKYDRTIIWDNQFISNQLIINDETIWCNGDITIKNGGRLAVFNSSLMMNSPVNGSRTILVENGGTFELFNSKLESNTTYSYQIYLQSGSKCGFFNSEIKDFDYYCGTAMNSGLNTESNDFIIDGSILYFNGYGIIAKKANTIIRNSTFYPAHKDELTGALDCIRLYDSRESYDEIENCTIHAVLNYTSSYDSAPGFSPNGELLINNSTFSQCAFRIANNGMDAYISNSKIITNIGRSVSALRITNGSADFENCLIINNKSYGVALRSTNTTFLNCSIAGSERDIIMENHPSVKAIANMVNTNYSTYLFENNVNQINAIHILNLRVLSQKTNEALDNATVKIYDKNGIEISNTSTDSEGRINNIRIVEKCIQNQSITVFTPHSIKVEKKGIVAPLKTVDMSLNRDLEILFDDQSPFLDVIYPPEELLTNSSYINIIGTSEKGSRVTINGDGINNIEGAFNSTYWLMEGRNTILIRATDAAGNFMEISRNVTALLLGPSLVINTPRDGFITNLSSLTISGTTNGTRMEINGVPVEISSNGEFFYLYKFPEEGPNNITIIAWNVVNNSAIIRLKVTYDATIPFLDIVSPAGNTYTNKSLLTITGKTTGASLMEINGLEVDLARNGHFEYEVMLVEGENVFHFEVRDIAGNENITDITIYLDSNNYLEILAPYDDILVNVDDIEIIGRTELLAEVTVNGVPVENRVGNFSYVVKLTEGDNIISIVSVDRASNYIFKSLKITADRLAPNFTVLNPENVTLKISTTTIRIKTEKDANLTINDQRTVSEGNGVFSITVTLSEGVNRYTIKVNDLAGNVRTRELTLTYIPERPIPPSDGGLDIPVWIPVLLVIAIIAIVIIVLIMVVRKKKVQR